MEVRVELFDSADDFVGCLKTTESRKQIGSDIRRAGYVLDLKVEVLNVPLPSKHFGRSFIIHVQQIAMICAYGELHIGE